MAERIKVFFASSSELKDEREKCIYITNKLRKAHEHLDIDPVLWEHDMTHSSFPGNTNIQDAITNSELKDSPIVVFLFHSKIGQYTREEFEYATKNNKKVFIYFKAGFSPEEEQLEAYTELLRFKKSLNSTVLYDSFKDLTEFENILFSNLNLYFAQQYRVPSDTTTALPSADIKNLMMQMMQEMKAQKNTDTDSSTNQLAELQAEIKRMREQLFAKDEKAKAQHEKTKQELEQRLSGGKEGNESLVKALEEIEAGNYDIAEDYLLKRVEELKSEVRAHGATAQAADDIADAYYQLGRTQELQYDYKDAFNYYTLAHQTLPEVAEYIYEMARMAVELEMWDDAIEYYDAALPGIIEAVGENSWEVADIYIGIAACSSARGNEEDNVIECIEAALEIKRIIGDEEDPALIVAYDNLGFAYRTKDDFAKAIKYSKKAIALSIKLDGKDNSTLPYYYQTLGETYIVQGEYEKALDAHSKAIDIYLANFEEDDPGIKLFYISLGAAYKGLGAFDEALDCFKSALAISKSYAVEDGWPVEDIQREIKEIAKEKKNAG